VWQCDNYNPKQFTDRICLSGIPACQNTVTCSHMLPPAIHVLLLYQYTVSTSSDRWLCQPFLRIILSQQSGTNYPQEFYSVTANPASNHA